MSEKYRFRDPEGMYFLTMATAGWVDLFTRKELKHVIVDSLFGTVKRKRVSNICLVSYAKPSYEACVANACKRGGKFKFLIFLNDSPVQSL
jgi:hypothetical protein